MKQIRIESIAVQEPQVIPSVLAYILENIDYMQDVEYAYLDENLKAVSCLQPEATICIRKLENRKSTTYAVNFIDTMGFEILQFKIIITNE